MSRGIPRTILADGSEVIHGDNGVYVVPRIDAGQAAEQAAHVRKLLDDPDFVAAMGHATHTVHDSIILDDYSLIVPVGGPREMSPTTRAALQAVMDRAPATPRVTAPITAEAPASRLLWSDLDQVEPRIKPKTRGPA